MVRDIFTFPSQSVGCADIVFRNVHIQLILKKFHENCVAIFVRGSCWNIFAGYYYGFSPLVCIGFIQLMFPYACIQLSYISLQIIDLIIFGTQQFMNSSCTFSNLSSMYDTMYFESKVRFSDITDGPDYCILFVVLEDVLLVFKLLGGFGMVTFLEKRAVYHNQFKPHTQLLAQMILQLSRTKMRTAERTVHTPLSTATFQPFSAKQQLI